MCGGAERERLCSESCDRAADAASVHFSSPPAANTTCCCCFFPTFMQKISSACCPRSCTKSSSPVSGLWIAVWRLHRSRAATVDSVFSRVNRLLFRTLSTCQWVALTFLPHASVLTLAHAATVAAKLKGELESFERAINKMLAVPHDIVVPPFTSPTLTSNERLLGRVLRVDTLLRQLQAGPQRRVAIEDAFTGCEAVLERLLSFVSTAANAWCSAR